MNENLIFGGIAVLGILGVGAFVLNKRRQQPSEPDEPRLGPMIFSLKDPDLTSDTAEFAQLLTDLGVRRPLA